MEMTGLVDIEITVPLPEECVLDRTYRIEGNAKAWEIGAPPWVYAEVRKKDWYKPEIIEETSYERGFPAPVTGKFNIEWTPRKKGNYDVIVIATPAPLSLPLVGVFPITGQADMMKTSAVEEVAGEYKDLRITQYEKVTT